MLINFNAALDKTSLTCRPWKNQWETPGKASRQYQPQIKFIFRRFLDLEFKKLFTCTHLTSSFGCDFHHPDPATLTWHLQLLDVNVKLLSEQSDFSQDSRASIFTPLEAWTFFQPDHAWVRNRDLDPDFANQFIISPLSRSTFCFGGFTIFSFNPRAGVS